MILREGLSEPEFYGDLVYKFKKLIGRNDFFFSVQKAHYMLQTYRLGPELLVCCLAHRGSTGVFAPGFSKLSGAQGSPSSGSLLNL